MATAATGSTSEVTKLVYGSKMEKLDFDVGLMDAKMPFRKGETGLGDKFRINVALTFDHGATYNGTDGAVVTLADPNVSTDKQAEVAAYEFIMRTRIADRIMSAAMANGPTAFEDATSMRLRTLQSSAKFRVEQSNLYGQQGLGQISVDNTGGVYTITPATWTSGTWDNMEGALLEAWTGQTATETQHGTDLTITAVDHVNHRITLTGTGTSGTIVANDWLYFKGARTATAFNEMMGIAKIMTTTSGTIFGISATTYSRWRSNTHDMAGTPNFEKYLAGITKLAGRRVKSNGKTATDILMPPQAYEVINADLAGARRYDGSYQRGKGTIGNSQLEFYGQTGATTFTPYCMIRDGDSFCFTGENGLTVGVKDLTFLKSTGGVAASGSIDGDLWMWRQDQNAYEARVGAILQPFFQRPSHCVGYSGITYPS